MITSIDLILKWCQTHFSPDKTFTSDCCVSKHIFPTVSCPHPCWTSVEKAQWVDGSFFFVFSFFFLRHYGLFCVTFQPVPTVINLHSFTSFATGLKVFFFLPLPHLILFRDWKVKISAMRITVSCACRSTFQLGTRPSAAGSRPWRKQERSMQRLPFPRSRLKLSSSGLPQRMFCWGSTASICFLRLQSCRLYVFIQDRAPLCLL